MSQIADPSLADQGRELIDWAGFRMPVLALIRSRFRKEKPLRGKTIGACLHITAETGNLLLCLQDGGAEVFGCASNPLSTKDEVVAALTGQKSIQVFAYRGEDEDTYFNYIRRVLEQKPELLIDDGADLIVTLHRENLAGPKLDREGWWEKVLGAAEETTTGVIRLKAMAQAGTLKIPVIAVNDSDTKHFFDNRYGTGQSTIDGILRATNILLAGKIFVVAGYGWCGRGIADRARGMGARVIVCEVNPVKALEAVMDGFEAMGMNKAVGIGEVFVTATGADQVITVDQMRRMKDGAILANAGHFNVEVDYQGLVKTAKKEKTIRSGLVEEFNLAGKKLYVIGEGRLVNLVAAEGHPAEVMDLSFANQALAMEFLVEKSKACPKQSRRVESQKLVPSKVEGSKLAPGVHRLPEEIDLEVAGLKLEAMGVKI